MSLFKIASWNVNSLKVRLPQLLDWLLQYQPDVIALQETKLEDKNFPSAELSSIGYHAVFSGQKTYNGVAILSRIPASGVISAIPDFVDPQRRVLVATVNDIQIVNLYVPNGASVGSDKYAYKLAWFASLNPFIKGLLQGKQPVVVLGDFNIAPEDRDIYNPTLWQGQVLCSEPERQALRDLMAHGFWDTFRLFQPDAGHYTWWDYRAGSLRQNHGLRIDHILASAELRDSCQACIIDKQARLSERPSDHAPIMSTFDI